MIQTIARLLRLVRLRPFDTSTEEGRAQERHRRIALTAAANAAARFVTAAASFVSVPLTLNYLGKERFGLWMTISSVIAMLSFADLGMGNGLMNEISSAKGRDDADAIRRLVASGYAILGAVGAVVLAAFFAVYPHVPWDRVFNVGSPEAAAEAGPALAAFVVVFAFNIPLGVIQRVQLGLQAGFVASLWQCAGSLLGLGAVVAAIKLEAGLPYLVAALAGAPAVAALVNSLTFFLAGRAQLRPRLSGASWRMAARIMRTGFLFLVLQLAAALAFQSDNMVITSSLGPAEVSAYAVTQKLFSVVGIVLQMAVMPLWPAYGEAIARRDLAWVRRTLRASVVRAVAFAACVALLLVLAHKPLIRAWAGPLVEPAWGLVVLFGAWTVLEALGATISVFLNGAGVIGYQVVAASAMALAAFGLKLLLVGRLGAKGAILATILAYSTVTLGSLSFMLPRILRKMGKGTGTPT